METQFLSVLRDSVETSVSMGLFKTRRDALYAHVYQTKVINLSFSKIRQMDNFNPARLQRRATDAYPPKDRPRGKMDVESVRYYKKKIEKKEPIPLIWVLKKRDKLILLDGAHRIVAHYIAKKMSVKAYLIDLSSNPHKK